MATDWSEPHYFLQTAAEIRQPQQPSDASGSQLSQSIGEPGRDTEGTRHTRAINLGNGFSSSGDAGHSSAETVAGTTEFNWQ